MGGGPFILNIVFLVNYAIGIELVANYKFWNAANNEIFYDYSSSSRHGSTLNGSLIFTDRGVYSDNNSVSTIYSISNPVITLPDFALSFWSMTLSGGHLYVKLHFFITISYMVGGGGLTGIYHSSNFVSQRVLSGWNLFTIRFYYDPIALSTKYVHFYFNLDDSGRKITGISQIQNFDMKFASRNIYELWAHTGVSSISDLNYLIYNNCPTSPTSYCLSAYDKYLNKEGTGCPTICTSSRLSCDTNLNCIEKSKSGCLYGLYDLDSGDCIFFCPEDSCSCSSKVNCSCKLGFKMISSNFVGCVPESWVNYHKEGYIYVKDEFGEGYSLDSDGNCCICVDGYTAVSSIPFVCMLMPNCLAFAQKGDTYICSQCIEGYQLNSEGLCLDCSEGYEKISDDSIECIPKIERCQEYIKIDDSFKCKTCKPGYRFSSSGLCDECQEGYIRLPTDSQECKYEIQNCIEYDIFGEGSKCSICNDGYMLDAEFKCNLCQPEHIMVSTNPSGCAYSIDRCISYMIYEGDWVCKRCEEGYKLDNQMECGECALGYISQANKGSECIKNNLSSPDSSENADNEDQGQDDEEEITQTQRERGDMIESVNTAAKTTFIVSTSVSGVVSDDSSIIIFYLNTIQLLSYLLNLNINLPFEIKQEQGAAKKFMQKLNILSYFKHQGKNPRDYLAYIMNDEKGFIPNMIYQLLILMLLFILNAIFYCLNKFSKGKVKNLAGKVLKLFTYTIYIQFMMLTYLDFADSALLKILNPEESLISNMIDYNLAVLFMIFCVISPLFLGMFISKNKAKLADEEFIGAYAFLVRDFKHKVFYVYFHVIFLVRRLILVLSVHLVYKLPLAQAILCSFVCWIVFIHVIITRPFKDRVFNILMISIELAISICYTAAGILLYPSINEEVIMWVMLGCMYLSYLLHSILGYYKLIKVIYPKIKSCISKKDVKKTNISQDIFKSEERDRIWGDRRT